MDSLGWISSFIAPLEALGVRYVVTGSVAAMIAGEPRMTNDVDLVIDLELDAIDAFLAAYPADRFYVPPREVILTELRRDSRGHFNVIEHASMMKADLYTAGRDPLHVWALERAQRTTFGGGTIAVAPIEYVIVRKLEFYRDGGSSKHLRDIASIVEASGASIDRSWLDAAIAERGLTREWNACQR